ncbi:MAG: (Fe-S)-binding protein [Gemmatimonadetes bacterium]|nr:(Fe-S)-binding protein [Gemmatimonadota bacterium]
MLSPYEKILFAIAMAVSLYLASVTFRRMIGMIKRGQGRLAWDGLPSRLMTGIKALAGQNNMIRNRPLVSLAHTGIAWGFILYMAVNLVDVLEGMVTGFVFLENGTAGQIYRLVVDLMTLAVLAGMVALLIRRFIVKSTALAVAPQVKLHPGAADGIRRDSLIVGCFILGHVGFRLLGASFDIAIHGPDPWQPVAALAAGLWTGLEPSFLTFGLHASWWIAIGLVLVFLPWFPYSKHAHLFMGPFNLMTSPDRVSPGALDALDFEDETIEQFGAGRITDLNRTHITDAFACIMCNRCQDACPAYATGKELSPAALEVNKRYHLRDHMKSLARGGEDTEPLLGYAMTESALWACTACGACSEACPVGNEPMFDILAIRQNQVLMESAFPNELKGAFTGIERNGNPWQMAGDRMEWTETLDFKVPTVAENPGYEVLFWVGCAGAFDPAARDTARAIATVMHRAGVDFAVLGNDESCTGDLARRAGNEYLFSIAAEGNIETLNAAGADRKKIVTGCPHCLHTLKNEYGALGGRYKVMHHTGLIDELASAGRLAVRGETGTRTTYHDPCYLGRHGGEYEAPRGALAATRPSLVEMARSRERSFCCGAGGAQVWKEEEEGREAVSDNRFREARETGADTLAVGCPFCARMMNDANKRAGEPMRVRDIAEIVAESLQDERERTHHDDRQ